MVERLHGLIQGSNLSCHRFVFTSQFLDTRQFSFDCLLTRQDYTLTVATQYPEGFSQDWVDDALSFSVVDARDVAGLANLRTRVNWRRIPA